MKINLKEMITMKGIKKIKGICQCLAGVGVGLVIKNGIKATTPMGSCMVNKLLLSIGGFVLIGMMDEKVRAYVDRQFDGLVKDVKEVVDEVKKMEFEKGKA